MFELKLKMTKVKIELKNNVKKSVFDEIIQNFAGTVY